MIILTMQAIIIIGSAVKVFNPIPSTFIPADKPFFAFSGKRRYPYPAADAISGSISAAGDAI